MTRPPRRPSGVWHWQLDDPDCSLPHALDVAARMTAVLERHDLLRPTTIGWMWYPEGAHSPTHSTRPVTGAADVTDLMLLASDPATLARVHSGAPPVSVSVDGPGSWFAADGTAVSDRLVELTLYTAVSMASGLAVYHDMWMPADFAGRPHPQVHARNAPRLTAALRELNQLLKVDAEPDHDRPRLGGALPLGIDNLRDDDGNPDDVTALM
jgi:hypothetical protein